jgi:tetratricopeptide (TPR) repeat protein
VALKADILYHIEMTSVKFASVVRVEDQAHKTMIENKNLDRLFKSWVSFLPEEDGTYVIVATSSKPAQGKFTLKVTTQGRVVPFVKATHYVRTQQWAKAFTLFDAFGKGFFDARGRGDVLREYVAIEQREKALEFYTYLDKRFPNDAEILRERAMLAAQLKDWPRAAADYARVIELDPKASADCWYEHAAASLLAGDAGAHAKACALMLERAGKDANMRPFLVVRALTLGKMTEKQSTETQKLCAEELTNMRDRYAALTLQGALDVRAGRHAKAQAGLEQCLKTHVRWQGLLVPRLWLALALHEQGKTAEARQELERVDALLKVWGPHMPLRAYGAIPLHLHDWLEAQVLHREVTKRLAAAP